MAHSGSYSAEFSEIETNSGNGGKGGQGGTSLYSVSFLYQTLATKAGGNYLLSFWINNLGNSYVDVNALHCEYL